jgi:hypothetical protein
MNLKKKGHNMKTPHDVQAEIEEQSQPDGHPMELRISNALMIADIYGAIEVNTYENFRTKAWVIDQMVRALTGCQFEIINGRAIDIKEIDHNNPTDEYTAWINTRCEGGDYEWDEGLEP